MVEPSWDSVVFQVQLEGFLWALLAAVVWGLFLVLNRKVWKVWKAEPDNSEDKGLWAVAVGAVVVAQVITAFVLCRQVTKLVNPEYWASKEVRSSAGQYP